MDNWYKVALSEQESFNFYDDNIIKTDSPKLLEKHFSIMIQNEGLTSEVLSQILEEMEPQGELAVKSLLDKFGFQWKEVRFKNGNVIAVQFEEGNRWGTNSVYVITDFDYPSLQEGREWVDSLYDSQIYHMVDTTDFNQDFWEGVGEGFALYHATQEDNKDNILKNGLKPDNKTRGISNRGMGSAVFTSDDPESISSYGNVVFAIDIGLMKHDGYMPTVSMEEPFEDIVEKKKIAAMIGLEEYYPEEEYVSEGLYENTVAIYGVIPAKYLSIYSE